MCLSLIQTFIKLTRSKVETNKVAETWGPLHAAACHFLHPGSTGHQGAWRIKFIWPNANVLNLLWWHWCVCYNSRCKNTSSLNILSQLSWFLKLVEGNTGFVEYDSSHLEMDQMTVSPPLTISLQMESSIKSSQVVVCFMDRCPDTFG